ncbi:MAG: hypothetical protein RIA08_18020 [Roseovarius sp.]|uniref:hypothetical protein n=1 Tax=Roseovarius sp. TaxID=1486281 RepID=UPI0032ECD423
MHKHVLALAAMAGLSLATPPAAADEFSQALSDYYDSQIATWANDPALIAAVREQNAARSGLTQAEIDAMDGEWRSQVGAADAPAIDPVLNNPAADFLRARVEASGGVITEAFTMDANGLNVAATAVTSDMWQGDEAKFTETYTRGAGATHLGDVEFDESTQTYQGQISVTLTDPETGAALGALTVGINAEALM